jgi:hypothetical protein
MNVEFLGQLINRRSFAVAHHEPLSLRISEYSLPLVDHAGFGVAWLFQDRGFTGFWVPRFLVQEGLPFVCVNSGEGHQCNVSRHRLLMCCVIVYST